MRTFLSNIDVDIYGTTWCSEITLECPYCYTTNSFFNLLIGNECKHCNKKLPFESGMAKDIKKRVAYHVEA